MFDPRCLLHVRPHHVQATVSQPRGVHWQLKCVPGSNSSAALRSRLRRGRGAAARLRGVRTAMPRIPGIHDEQIQLRAEFFDIA